MFPPKCELVISSSLPEKLRPGVQNPQPSTCNPPSPLCSIHPMQAVMDWSPWCSEQSQDKSTTQLYDKYQDLPLEIKYTGIAIGLFVTYVHMMHTALNH